MAGTYLELINDAFRYLKIPSVDSVDAAATGQWSPAQMGIRVNKSQRELLVKAGGYRRRFTDVSVADQPDYSIPVDIASINAVRYDGELIIYKSPTEISLLWDDYRTTTGTPLYWYVSPVGETSGSQRYMGLAYVPSTADVTIAIDGRSVGETMTDGDDLAFGGDQYLYENFSEAVVLGAVIKCLMEEGDERYKPFKIEYEGEDGNGGIKADAIAAVRRGVKGSTMAWQVIR
jgi:hypothetical protein